MARRKSILVVDDFPAMRSALRGGLESVGFRDITLASNGREAWKLLNSEKFDLVISDLNMPQVNGLELLDMIRQDDQLKYLPFILVTAEREKDLITKAIDLGVTDCLIKPYRPGYFIEKVQKAFKTHSPPVFSQNQSSVSNFDEAAALAGCSVDETMVSSVEPSDGKETILVVDDVEDNISVIANLLKPLYKIKVAKSGEKALEIAQSNELDLILLDIVMPEMDGYEVCKRLKETYATEDIPVIFLSGKNDVENITEGFRLGAVDYITKPIEPEILMARVKTHMALRRTRLDLIKQVDTLLENARLKEDVERIIQHDLTNPLAAVATELELLIQNKNLSSRGKDIFRSMQRSVGQALSTVSSSLDLYKIEKGKFNFKPKRVDISETLNQVIRDLHDVAESREVVIEKRDKVQQVFVSGDGVLCYSMFSNLVRNAIEASSANDTVLITIETRADGVFVHIENNGVIDPSIRSKLFDKYVTANKKNGTGLGTYSAQLMAGVQGGELSFDTKDEQATVFTVKLRSAEG